MEPLLWTPSFWFFVSSQIANAPREDFFDMLDSRAKKPINETVAAEEDPMAFKAAA